MKKDLINGRILYKFLCVNNILNAFVTNAINYVFYGREDERKECNTLDDMINKALERRQLKRFGSFIGEPSLIVFLEYHHPMVAFPWAPTKEGAEFWRKCSDKYDIFKYDFQKKMRNGVQRI